MKAANAGYSAAQKMIAGPKNIVKTVIVWPTFQMNVPPDLPVTCATNVCQTIGVKIVSHVNAANTANAMPD